MDEQAKTCRVYGVLEVGVLHHQQRTLAAHFEIELLAAFRAFDADLAPDCR
jgi:hypothetical protein